jgi:hypothetical protein
VAWTLLESGVPADDPFIQKAAEHIRKAMVYEPRTYNISLGIFFFNRLGDSRDIPFIEGLATRLLGGQCANGSWSYLNTLNPQTSETVVKLLNKALKAREEGTEKAVAVALPRDQSKLCPETRQALTTVAGRQPQQSGDNSNTQFAMLALWVAGRYGVPVQNALGGVEFHFRKTQRFDGSWAYVPVAPTGPVPLTAQSKAMTAAGLLGLALGHANNKNKALNANLLADRQVLAGFTHLARIMRGGEGAPDAKHYYFLWTLERMAVTYNLTKIDNIDWYVWGAKQFLEKQGPDGGWKGGEYSQGGCDTCFALLFLKKVNLAPDITRVVVAAAVKNKKEIKKGKFVPIDVSPIVEEPTKEKGSKKSSMNRRPDSIPWGPRPDAFARIEAMPAFVMSTLPRVSALSRRPAA